MFEVKKNVPRPVTKARYRGALAKYPFSSMEAGDYFEVPISEFQLLPDHSYDGRKHRERVNSAARGYALKTNKMESSAPTNERISFTVLLLDSGNIGVWRD